MVSLKFLRNVFIFFFVIFCNLAYFYCLKQEKTSKNIHICCRESSYFVVEYFYSVLANHFSKVCPDELMSLFKFLGPETMYYFMHFGQIFMVFELIYLIYGILYSTLVLPLKIIWWFIKIFCIIIVIFIICVLLKEVDGLENNKEINDKLNFKNAPGIILNAISVIPANLEILYDYLNNSWY